MVSFLQARYEADIKLIFVLENVHTRALWFAETYNANNLEQL